MRLSGLNLLDYNANVLKVIVSSIRRPMRVGLVTDEVGRQKFARICVEVNLNLLIVQKVWI